MGNIQTILGIMRKFTPKGQETAMKILKENRQVLSEEFGFAKLPSIIAGQGKARLLEGQLTDKSSSLKNIVKDELEKFANGTTLNDLDSFYSRHCYYKISKKMTDEIASDFSKKQKLLAEFVAKELGNKNLAKNILEADSAETLLNRIESIITEIFKSHAVNMTKYEKLVPEHAQKYHFRLIQIITKEKEAAGDKFLACLKMIHSQSTDKKIIKLENTLSKKYNLKYIHLTDERQADELDKALEIAQKNGIEIPRNVIFSPIDLGIGATAGFHFKLSNGEHTIFINTLEENVMDIIRKMGYKKLEATYLKEYMNTRSTGNPLHVIMHEIVHDEGIPFEISPKKIKKLKSKEHVLKSEYAKKNAAENNFEEVRTELRTKQILEELNQEEKEYLDIIG